MARPRRLTGERRTTLFEGHAFKIEADKGRPSHTRIWVDGQPLEGVTKIQLLIGAGPVRSSPKGVLLVVEQALFVEEDA